jgi:hypothetical protein
MIRSKHSQSRCQKRGIPLEIQKWLSKYGVERHIGRCTVLVSFNRISIKAMQKEMGRHYVQQNKKYLNTYRVESLDGTIITTGWKTPKFRRYH